jgi:hypothetical protein
MSQSGAVIGVGRNFSTSVDYRRTSYPTDEDLFVRDERKSISTHNVSNEMEVNDLFGENWLPDRLCGQLPDDDDFARSTDSALKPKDTSTRADACDCNLYFRSEI